MTLDERRAERPAAAPGRPRNPDTQVEILNAAASILCAEGFRALTIERVASTAGVAKTTVYRRWKSMVDLVSDLLDEANEAWPMPTSDHDDIADGLRMLYRNWVVGMSGPGRIIPVLIAEAVQNEHLATLLHERFVLPRRDLAIAMIERAKRRRQVRSDADSETVIDMFMGRMWYRRLVTGERIALEDDEKLVELFLRGLQPRAPHRPRRIRGKSDGARAS